jgi:HD superfamily phosphohydrolase
MFVSVYYHHTSVNFDEMLRRFSQECPGEISIPTDPEQFVDCDDVWLAWWLRKSRNVWARRIVERRGFKLVAQATGRDKEYDFPVLDRALTEAGVEHFQIDSFGALSKYFASDEAGPSLYVVDPATGLRTPVAEYTPLYKRYAEAIRLTRLYCRPDQTAEAREIVARVIRAQG